MLQSPTTPATDERLARLEAGFDQMNERLGALERGLEAVRQSIDSRFNTLVLIISGMWVTTTGGIITLAAILLND